MNKLATLLRDLFGRVRAVATGEATQLQKSALIALAVKIGAAGLGFGTQILFARLLGADEYGLYSYYWVWIMVGGFITSLGFAEAATRFIAQYRETEAYGLGWGFIYHSIALVIAVSGLIALCGLVGLWIFTDTLPPGNAILILLALACLPIFALQDLLEGSALAFSWTGLAQIPPYILRQVLIALFLLAMMAASLPATAQTALMAVLAAALISTVTQLVLFLKRTRNVLPKAKREIKPGYWFKTALPMLMANGFQLCLTFSDIIILGFFVEPDMVALYFAATRISSQVTAVQFAVTSAVAQRMSGLNATNETAALHALLADAVRWIFWPTLAVTIGLLVAGWPLLWLFGPEFTAAYSLLPILALGLLVRASTGGAEDALKMVGHERAEFMAKAGSTLLNLVLNFSLIPWLGIHGAAIATALSIIAYSITIEMMVRRLIGGSSFIATLPKGG